MEDIRRLLNDLLERLPANEYIHHAEFIDIKSKLKLYVEKFFPNRADFHETVAEIDVKTDDPYKNSIIRAELKSLITTLIEDINLSGINIISAEERERLSKIMEEVKLEQKELREEQDRLIKLNEQLLKEKDRVSNAENKFNDFTAKLEIADKELDFQFQAKDNKNKATGWAIASGVLVILLLITLVCSLNSIDNFSKISTSVKTNMSDPKINFDQNLIANTIYFTYGKFIFTKLLLYSIILYAIMFCVRNYNAQMHNHVINSHKSNAFKSTISLLNTAVSEEGNDKLLLQATQAIFSHQQSGYTGKENEVSSPNMITNVIDSAAKKL